MVTVHIFGAYGIKKIFSIYYRLHIMKKARGKTTCKKSRYSI